MAKFVDKQNLPQYRYFNNVIGKDDMVKDIISDYVGGVYELSTPAIQNDPAVRRESLQMLKKGKRNLPAALYSMKEDQERCHNEIFYGGVQATRRNADRYINMLLHLHFFFRETTYSGTWRCIRRYWRNLRKEKSERDMSAGRMESSIPPRGVVS